MLLEHNLQYEIIGDIEELRLLCNGKCSFTHMPEWCSSCVPIHGMITPTTTVNTSLCTITLIFTPSSNVKYSTFSNGCVHLDTSLGVETCKFFILWASLTPRLVPKS